MAVFGGLVLTNVGRNLYAKAQTGKLLKFKRIALGDGELGSTESMVNLTNLKHEVLSCEINTMRITENVIAKITFILKNQELQEGFLWRELGVIAEDPDTQKEILYCYGNARENSEYIPASGGADILEKSISIDIVVENVANVSAIINESLIFLNKKEILNNFEECENQFEKVPSAKLFFESINQSKTVVFNTYSINTDKTIMPNEDYLLPSQYKAGMNTLDVFYMGYKLSRGKHYNEVGVEGELSNVIQFLIEEIQVGEELQFVFREYIDNNEIEYNTLNNRINNILNKVNVKRYSLSTQVQIEGNTDFIIPFSYIVGDNTFEVYFEGVLLNMNENYIEVGDIGSTSNKIQFKDWSITKNSFLQFIRRGDENG